MKITAALAWWDERPEDLAACVRSLANIADAVVAIDGAYQRYPGGTASSDPEQAAAIVAAAEEIGIACRIVTPKRLWRGEPEKRTRLMREAAKGSDWVAVIDADMIVHADREAVRSVLESNPDVDVYTVDVRTLPGPSAATQWHEKLPDQVLPFIHLFRVYPDMRVERFHWWYSASRNGRRFWYEYGGNSYAIPDGREVCEPAHLDGYWMEHSVLLRNEARMLASRGYYNDRTLVVDLTGQEDAVPGLPEPVWDFELRDINDTGHQRMKITAALAWWNERPEDLTACVTAAARIADRIVAVDGAYSRYPDATARSAPEQAEAIRKAAREAGIECVIHERDTLWAGQVEKRTFLLREAAKDSDWVLVIDADHIVHTDRVAARGALEAMPDKVRFVSVDFTTPLPPDRTLDESAATQWHREVAGVTFDMAVLFRSAPNFEVRGKHWYYWGSRSGPPTEMHYGGKADAKLPVPFLVEHRTLFRTEQQVLDSRAFLNDRVMVVARTGQEDDRPELPRPVFDYVTVPYSRNAPAPPRGKTAREETVTPVLSRYKPPLPWEATEPNRVLTLGEAARGLEKGYKVMTRFRGRGLTPEIPVGDVIVLEPATKLEPGAVMLAKVRHDLVIERVDADLNLVDKRGRPLGVAKQVFGVVTYHGPHWPEKGAVKVQAEKLTEGVPPKPAKVKAAPVAAPAKRKPGRPKGSGRKAVAVK